MTEQAKWFELGRRVAQRCNKECCCTWDEHGELDVCCATHAETLGNRYKSLQAQLKQAEEEIEALKHDNDRMYKDLTAMIQEHDKYSHAVATLVKYVKRRENLAVENKRLREVLENIANGDTPWVDGYSETSGEIFMKYAQQALSGIENN